MSLRCLLSRDQNQGCYMRSIGFRASPKEVIYAVCEQTSGNSPKIIDVDRVKIPVALQLPEQLSYVRRTILDLIQEYSATRAGIRISEPFASKFASPSIERISIEAVIQELINTSSIERYFTGVVASISSHLELPKKHFAKIIDGEIKAIEGIDLQSYKDNQKEAILSALASLKL